MEITTKQIIKKIRVSVIKKLEPFVRMLINEGAPRYDIDRAIQNYVNMEIKRFYRKSKEPVIMREVLKIENLKDSKAEATVAYFLEANRIKFKFQYKIGPYTADYLVAGFIVLELDGPQHANQKEHDNLRDRYMQRMGYEVVRVPVKFFALSPTAVVEHLLDLIDSKKTKKRKVR